MRVLLLGLIGVVLGAAGGVQAWAVKPQAAYSRLTEGVWQIWTWDPAAGLQRQVTFSKEDRRYPVWMHDGSILAHTSAHGVERIDAPRGGSNPFLEGLWPVRDLALSPQGDRAAFARFRTDVVDAANLWVVDLKTGTRKMITDQPGIQFNPSWSPDGRQLAYSGGQGYQRFDIFVTDPDGANQRQLTETAAHEFLPSWSPDGTRIAFVSDQSGDYEIWSVQPDGSGMERLTRSPGLDTRPAWLPDGSGITFTTNRSGELEIWQMDSDGTKAQPLIRTPDPVRDLAWRR